MRTRFLATEYSVAAGGGGPVEILDFVPLPLPDISPSIYARHSADFSLSFDEIPVFGACGEIEKLPIEDVLSVFLSDVLPRSVDGAGSDEPRIESSEGKSKLIPTEENDGATYNSKGGDPLKFVEFEIPEMDITSRLLEKSAVHSQIECLHIFSKMSDAESIMDTLNSEALLHNLSEIQQSVYSVDGMNVEYSIDQKSDLMEDAEHVQGGTHSHNMKFPLFEVDVESLGILGRVYVMDELPSFEHIEKQQVVFPDEVISNSKELLGSMDFDLIKYLLQNCVAIHCLEESFPSQLEYISMIDMPCCQEYLTVHGKTGGDLIWSRDPVLFDEFLLFSLNAYHFCEVFSESAQEIEAETCDSVFGEAMNFRSFSELIVCHELTLMDDYFKSLPVPIFSDRGNCSPHELVGELLPQLDWKSLSASDDLYLDWHFLREDDCGSGKYSSRWKILCEIDTYNIDAAMNPSEIGKQIFDFLLSDCHSEKSNAHNYKEILNVYCSDISTMHPSCKASLSTPMDHGERKNINEDTLLRTDAEKVPRFFESMSSDLAFFLNPRNYMTGRETTHPDQSVGANTVCQTVFSTDDSAAANITTDVQQKWNTKMHQKGDLGSASPQKECETKLEDLFNTVPENEHVNEGEGCSMTPVQSMSVGLESKQELSCKALCPKTIIIVNTRNFNDEMVISRRSTYQRILGIEQEGAQVVERDIELPVDVILGSSVCLTWYDRRNIGRKASAPDEAFSCLPLCVESIAASILTSLSFAFSCCILIFEGDSNFLCSIMESSDKLYAAAASLGINIQLFCSYSCETTEDIILSWINVASELGRGLYPRMLDSESLAESFLTAFPPINPLSAHAILSSDVILVKFMELSNLERICALKKYKVPDESVALLGAISRYGEHEGSKSGLTNSSSSVSVPVSESVRFKIASERKKPKHTHYLYDAGEPPNDLFHKESLNLLQDDQPNLPKLPASCNSWLADGTEIYNKSNQIDLSFNDNLLGHYPDIDVGMMKSINKSSLQDFHLTKGLQITDEREKLLMPQIDIDCSPRRRSDTPSKKSFTPRCTKVIGTLPEKFTGEVVDVEDSPTFIGNFSVGDFSSSSLFALDVEKDFPGRSSRMIKRPYCATNLPLFTNPTDNNSALGDRISRDKTQILRKEVKPHFDTINRHSISMTNQNGLVKENTMEKDPQIFNKLPFQDKGTRSFDGTQQSNALYSTQPQGSPWTIEFYNRTREKSLLLKQSVSHDLSHPCFDSPGNTSKLTKRKSPSVIGFYKYEGRNTPQEKVDQKRLKISSQPAKSSKKKNASTSCSPSWTPDDKIARRALSFSSNASGGQSKLVWKDNKYQTAQRRLQYQIMKGHDKLLPFTFYLPGNITITIGAATLCTVAFIFAPLFNLRSSTTKFMFSTGIDFLGNIKTLLLQSDRMGATETYRGVFLSYVFWYHLSCPVLKERQVCNRLVYYCRQNFVQWIICYRVGLYVTCFHIGAHGFWSSVALLSSVGLVFVLGDASNTSDLLCAGSFKNRCFLQSDCQHFLYQPEPEISRGSLLLAVAPGI